MVRLVENERSWAIELISEINSYLSSVNLQMKKAGGETTINNYRNADGSTRKIMFPDVLIYSDSERNNLLQGWEVKLPDVPIHNEEYIRDAQYKADKLGLNSTVLWNFHDVVLYVKDSNGYWRVEHQWNNLNSIKNREDVRRQQDIWKRFLTDFLNELSDFYTRGVIEERKLVEISNSLTTFLIEDNKESLAQHLRSLSRSNRLIAIDISKWWNIAKTEYLQDESDEYVAYSKNILLNWIIRFTFGHIILNTHTLATQLQEITSENTPAEANKIFQSITETSDFYTIFTSQEYSELLPNSVWGRLVDFNAFLNDKILDHGLMQRLLENSVNQYKREVIGQFTTPEKLALLLLHSTVINLEGNDIDPCCGTGIIPKKLIELKLANGISEADAHEKTWASDKMLFPLQIANMSITTHTSMNIINKVFQRSVFELNNNIPVKLTSPADGEDREYILPKFTNITSNLPFVPFEIIEESEREYISEITEQVNRETSGNIGFSRRSDFYFYIITYLNSILEENGRIGVITSNSWLGTDSGKILYRLLIHYYKVKTIIISGNKKWFPNANVMSSIIVLEKKVDSSLIQETPIDFVVLKRALNDLNNEEIIDVSHDILRGYENDNISLIPYSVGEIHSYTNRYQVSLNSLFYNVNWLNDLEDKIIPVSEIFDVIRGIRRGWDPLFYPEAGHNIEPFYIQRLLKSSRSIIHYDAQTDSDAFCCSKSIEELTNLGHTGALSWINRFEGASNNTGRPLTEVLRSGRQRWYEMTSDGSMAELVTSLNPGSRLFWAKLEEPSFINQRLIGISRKSAFQNLDINLLHALLNSLVGQFFIESTGFGRGLGALDLSKDNIQRINMLNPHLLSAHQKNEIIQSFNNLKENPIGNTLEEINTPLRSHFDQTVLEAFGILDKYDSIKESLFRMQSSRLSANS